MDRRAADGKPVFEGQGELPWLYADAFPVSERLRFSGLLYH